MQRNKKWSLLSVVISKDSLNKASAEALSCLDWLLVCIFWLPGLKWGKTLRYNVKWHQPETRTVCKALVWDFTCSFCWGWVVVTLHCCYPIGHCQANRITQESKSLCLFSFEIITNTRYDQNVSGLVLLTYSQAHMEKQK